jgi:hypothetical protein
MVQHNRAARLCSAMLWSFLSILLLNSEARADDLNGCTAAQIQSGAALTCEKKSDDDLINKRPNVHILRCSGGKMECCIRSATGGVGQCEATVTQLICADLKSERGEWKPDPNSIKANSDKKSCSQTFVCSPPAPDHLSADQRRCNPVVSVSNKQVTQTGTCVPGSKPGECSSCLARPPNESCMVSFLK